MRLRDSSIAGGGAGRLVLVLLIVVATCFTLRCLYGDVFREPRISAMSDKLDEWCDEDSGASERRSRVLRLRRNMGVGIDSLPRVRFTGGASLQQPRRKSGTVDDNNEELIALLRQKECLTYGSYVSPTDEFVDCRIYCNLSDGVEYRYYDKLGVFLNGRRGMVGGYCVPTDATICNTNTSITVYGANGWRCLPQNRAFAGEGGNRIVACNGNLLDRATGKIWHGHIDSTLAFDSIDELLPVLENTIEYRFVCPSDLKDHRGNNYISAPFDRLLLLQNTCAALIPHADESIRPLFEENRCDCGSKARYDDALKTCVPVVPDDVSNDIFNSRTLHSVMIERPCFEPWMTISQARNLSARGAKRICGVEHGSAGDGAANVGYERIRGAIFDRPVPSPDAMSM